MHALSILHRELLSSCPWMHAKRRSTLLAAVQAAVLGSRLRLSDLGRGLSAAVAVKHNIKRIDRLLGNANLHAETAHVYEMLARRFLRGVPTPLIIVDWSDLSADRHWQLLRASMALEGRSVTLYEEVHPVSRAAAPGVHKRFLLRLGAMLPPGCRPIVITDAGFRSPWFQLVERMGWHFVGRIRNRDMVRPLGGGVWVGCKLFYAKASALAQALGPYEYVRSNPIVCNLILVKRSRQGRHKKSVFGKKVCSRHSLKQARSQREPWLLAVSPLLSHLSAQAVVALYAQRMHADRRILSRLEKRTLRTGIICLPIQTKTTLGRAAVDRHTGAVYPAPDRRGGPGKATAVSVPEQHASFAPGALRDQSRVANCAKRRRRFPAG